MLVISIYYNLCMGESFPFWKSLTNSDNPNVVREELSLLCFNWFGIVTMRLEQNRLFKCYGDENECQHIEHKSESS